MKVDKNKLSIIVLSVLAASATWVLNHMVGLGPIVANGIIGVTAALLLPLPLAGVSYTSSFVGMSSLGVIPSLSFAVIGGFIAGVAIIGTRDIYAGVGGKGGTTAAVASIVTKAITGLFG